MSDDFPQDGGINRYTDLAEELSTAPGPIGAPGTPYPGPGVKENTVTVGAGINNGVTRTIDETVFYENELGSNDIIQVEWWGQGVGVIDFGIYWDEILLITIPTVVFPASYITYLAEFNSNSIFATSTGNGVSLSEETPIGGSITAGGTLKVLLRSSSNATVSSNVRIIKISQ